MLFIILKSPAFPPAIWLISLNFWNTFSTVSFEDATKVLWLFRESYKPRQLLKSLQQLYVWRLPRLPIQDLPLFLSVFSSPESCVLETHQEHCTNHYRSNDHFTLMPSKSRQVLDATPTLPCNAFNALKITKNLSNQCLNSSRRFDTVEIGRKVPSVRSFGLNRSNALILFQERINQS